MANKPTRGDVIAKGKTKTLFQVVESPGLVIVRNEDAITKNDDPDATQQLESKGRLATDTTCAVFELLKAAGLPVAYCERLSDTEFLAPRCKMIALEVVARRYAVGSYLKRFPNMNSASAFPQRFHRLVVEFFLKTTGGKIIAYDGRVLGETPIIDPVKGRHLDDPLIADASQAVWDLRSPKLPEWADGSNLELHFCRDDILPPGVTPSDIEELTRKVFLVLEGAWAQLGHRLIDFKIEFGMDLQGHLLVADVIDNDSWRLRTREWQELSKQLFRDCHEMDEIAARYALVAQLVQNFSIPQQAMVIWRGSENDHLPEMPAIPGVRQELVVLSGHKSPSSCLSLLEHTLALYPQGGVIIAIVGMSNGLGPMLAARTSWPVIAVPATAKARPHDVWSSLEVPSQVPLAIMISEKNALLAALNILGLKNPAAYATRQYAIEELDR